MFFRGKIKFKYTDGHFRKKVIWYEKEFDDVFKGSNSHTGHPELAGNCDLIRSTIESPSIVRSDKDYKNRYCYYSYFPSPRIFPMQHMKVVLVKAGRDKLEVVTAYMTDFMNPKETVIWSK